MAGKPAQPKHFSKKLWDGCETISQYVTADKNKTAQILEVLVMYNPEFVRGFQWDLARQMERMDFLLRWIPQYAKWGYNKMHLYLEDAFDYPSVPGVGRKGALTPRQMTRLTRAAEQHGIKTVPVVPLLGHAAYLTKVPSLSRFAERRNQSIAPQQCGQICPLHDDTVRLATQLLRDVAPYCTAGIVHVGLDESFDIAQCPKCRAEAKYIGLARHFANYILRLHAVCRELGLRMGMWGDMLYYTPEAIPFLPKDLVVYDWYYYPFRRLPRIEIYNFAEVDLTGRLRSAGIDVYGCPNNGPFMLEPITPFQDRLRNVLSWWHYGRQKNTQGLVITSWCPTRTSPELNSLVDAAAASLWLNPGELSPQKMLKQGLQRMWGIERPSVAVLFAAVEKYQYSGCYRWQTHTNWRALAHGDSVEPLRREESHFCSLTKRARTLKIPTPFPESLTIRHYISKKDLFLATASAQVFQTRRWVAQGDKISARRCLQQIRHDATALSAAIRQALHATRILWKRSRSAQEINPTEQMLQSDQHKVAELRHFAKQTSRDLRQIWQANPLTGQWQLLFWVRNFAPAWQRLVVQWSAGKESWKEGHSLMSMEFTKDAGTPKSDFRRHHAMAVDWDERKTLRIRLGIRAFGCLEIYDLKLTNGVAVLAPHQVARMGGSVERAEGLLHRRVPGAILGAPAPQRGFPPPDMSKDQGWVEVKFYRHAVGGEHFRATELG